MKKVALVFVSVIAALGMFAFTVDFTAENDFTFPEYVEALNLEDADGCHASCGTTSCSGSGNCVCSCSTFNCNCEAVIDPGPKSSSQSTTKIGLSINENQYENLKTIALMLYNSDDKKAKAAYLHMGLTIEAIIKDDYEEFHKEKELYFNSLAGINSETLKEELNAFFIKIGVNDRV